MSTLYEKQTLSSRIPTQFPSCSTKYNFSFKVIPVLQMNLDPNFSIKGHLGCQLSSVFQGELGACLGSRVRHHQGAFEALR